MSRPKRLMLVLALNLSLVAGLVAVGLSTHSLGILAAGGDYLADAAAIGLSLLAIWLSHRPPSSRRPGGYRNATEVAALVNGGWLLVLSVMVVATAIRRLVAGAPEIVALPVLIASAVAAVVMLAGVLILGGDVDREGGGEDLNMKAVMLDTAADAAAAAGVAISGAVILVAGGWFWLDPVVALVIAAVVGYHAVNLLRKVLTALRPQVGQ
ncbi:cation transporter [Mycobacterium sp. SM1]|uniref:cation diffusion facilitator family transporter n=1 Tax=Mycobacterium sp. SM1 TaxID=2816243 RepID=UPI001BD0BF56|nr:cation diffusion facilitator family transporter [Mycobacterium sp. SM1]MBS4728697.1 cation transporter [Mycobacterium sp. SM1]